MKSFEIVADSSCDLSSEYAKNNNIKIVPFSISFDSKTYMKEGVDIQIDEFYDRLRSGDTAVKTSLPSIQDYLDVFIPILEEGKDIACICLSSKFSGSYQSAINAATIAEEDYPDAKIIVIDSKNATGGQGYIVKEAVAYRATNKKIDMLEKHLEKIIENIRIYFTLDSLDYLARGGRIGKGAALTGTLLDIKPILYLNDGEIEPHSKVRRRKKALSALLEILDNELQKINGQYDIGILASTFNDEVQKFKEDVTQKYCTKTIETSQIGLTIGVHTGPTTIGFYIVRK